MSAALPALLLHAVPTVAPRAGALDEPPLPRGGLPSTHLRFATGRGDRRIMVERNHGLKVGHFVRFDAHLQCEPFCASQQPWTRRCAQCSCAACAQCLPGAPYHQGDPGSCRGPGAVEYSQIMGFGEDGQLQLRAALRMAHGAGASVRLLPEYACPLDCAGHGTCIASAAVCVCDAGWHGDGCDLEGDDEPPTPRATTAAAARRAALPPAGGASVELLTLDSAPPPHSSSSSPASARVDAAAAALSRQPAAAGAVDAAAAAALPAQWRASFASWHDSVAAQHGLAPVATRRVAGGADSARVVLSEETAGAGGASPHAHGKLCDPITSADCKVPPAALVASACPEGCNGRGRCLNDGTGANTTHRCVCRGGFFGLACAADRCGAAPHCSGRGACLEGMCACSPSFAGSLCEHDGCGDEPGNPCSGHGVCEGGRCVCESGWGGELCAFEMERCPHGCWGRGTCASGVCHCHSGWGGLDCSRPDCPAGCFGHGLCMPSSAAVAATAAHSDAAAAVSAARAAVDARAAAKAAVARAEAVVTRARAQREMPTEAAESESSPREGGPNGHWGNLDGPPRDRTPAWARELGRAVGRVGEAYKPTEDAAWRAAVEGAGPQLKPPEGFSPPPPFAPPPWIDESWTGPHKKWRAVASPLPAAPPVYEGAGVCSCDVGWGGVACELNLCADRCSGHGVCVEDATAPDGLGCECDDGWTGHGCSLDACGGCNGHGTCVPQQTVGRKGAFEVATRLGTTTKYVCLCYAGYQGAECADDTCPAGCSGHGYCNHGSCVCHVGWRGSACEEDTCPDHCGAASGRGTCVRGECACAPHRIGTACQLDTCPKSKGGLSCGGPSQGTCAGGQCFCRHGYRGEACEVPTCPTGTQGLYPCAGHGRCVSGLCACDPSWIGVACDVHWADPAPASAAAHSHALSDADRARAEAASRAAAVFSRGTELGRGHVSGTGSAYFRGMRAPGVGVDPDYYVPSSKTAAGRAEMARLLAADSSVAAPTKTSSSGRGAALAASAPATVPLPSTCSPPCGVHGECVERTCRCAPGYAGARCDEALRVPPPLETSATVDAAAEAKRGLPRRPARSLARAGQRLLELLQPLQPQPLVAAGGGAMA